MENQDRARRLSKTRILEGLYCPRRLYLTTHAPELAAQMSGASLAAVEWGTRVGELARRRYPGGVPVEFGPEGLGRAVRDTRRLLSDPAVGTIYEATVAADGILVRTDILRRTPNGWELIEVKSSATLKEHHLQDVAIQRLVLERAGLTVVRAGVLTLNREYVYEGGDHDLDRLFRLRDATADSAALAEELGASIRELRDVLLAEEAPGVETEVRCNIPWECPFHGFCHPPSAVDSIDNLPRLRGWRRDGLIARGVESIGEIPGDYPLTATQSRARRAVLAGGLVAEATFRGFVEGLVHPVVFLDFETVMPALPLWAGMRPWDQLAFQWSAHVLREPGGPVEHHEFLAPPETDPRRGFIESLLDLVERADGSIVVYGSFEGARLRELAGWFPEYRDRIETVRARLWDLLSAVRSGLYHPGFRGGFSLKNVLPALAPELSYDDLEIGDGGCASAAYLRLMLEGDSVSAEERRRVLEALREYCRRDTLAMIRVLRQGDPTFRVALPDDRDPSRGLPA